MSSLLYSLGRWAFRARGIVVGAWILILALVGGGALLFNQGLDNSISIPGTESQNALDSLSTTFPQVSGASAQLAVVAPDGDSVNDEAVAKIITDGVDALNDIDGVESAISPFDENIDGAVSENERAALISIQLDGSQYEVTEATKNALIDEADAIANALPDGSESALGGQLFSASFPALTATELIGVGVALVVLVLTFGSFLAAGMPLVTALLGVGISIAFIFIATAFGSITSTTPMLALMLGLAVGIDYALFIISRYQEQLRDGMEAEESAARSVATAGSAVIFAGLTVIIALVGLGVAGIPFLTVMGVSAAAGVAVAVVISITLIPAFLGLAGERLRPKPAKPSRKAKRAHAAAQVQAHAESAGEIEPLASAHRPNRFFAGWVNAATKFPIVTILGVVAVLGLVSAPALGLRLALPDAGGLPEGDPARVTYDIVSDNFGEGFNGPLIVTGSIVTSTDPLGLMDDLKTEIEKLDGVEAVPLATPNETADTGIVQVIPTGGPDSVETKNLVAEIRSMHDYFLDEYDVDLSVTGFTAVGIDISDKLGNALLPFGVIVVGLSLILLTMVFRSIWVPIKATLGYLLSVCAAFGVVALVFEYGWFAEALHIQPGSPVISFMPIILMGVLFGLAMDYEVFLVARMREDYVHSGKARESVTTGFLGSAKVVTAAAVIMFAVFAAFVPEGDTNIKPIALGLAVGVFVDAFIVRMTLVPAVLALLGEKAWWIPKWLDRALPSFDVEGEGVAKEIELRNWPAASSTDIATAEGLTLDAGETNLYTDVSFALPETGTMVVSAGRDASVTALLLTLSGRMQADTGILKVAGYVASVRAASVRSRVAFVSLSEASDPVGDLTEALREKPRLIALDGIDQVTDAVTRRNIYDALVSAQGAASRSDSTLAIAVGTASPATVADAVPGVETAVTPNLTSELAHEAGVSA
ncbi:MMPL family transporter [Mycetocola zhadangensis]|uniref:MMPL family transporter n=1 Tax=Mycetocola zhadangensis TaxID=1164595 RepID=A0A3L7J4V1_9MICO|nr:MMPL family transporter [Mycetocola zhadangensis]RLQ84491.1 MMPL family transporter [Mycetocola zhadangensis]GGE92502.1 RND transporter [Mycetocola zhadangensis]